MINKGRDTIILRQASLSSVVDSSKDGPTVVRRWPQNSTLALLVALALTLVVVLGTITRSSVGQGGPTIALAPLLGYGPYTYGPSLAAQPSNPCASLNSGWPKKGLLQFMAQFSQL